MERTVMGGATKPEEREGPGRAGPGRVRGGARRTWWSGPAEGRERENLLRRPVPMSMGGGVGNKSRTEAWNLAECSCFCK